MTARIIENTMDRMNNRYIETETGWKLKDWADLPVQEKYVPHTYDMKIFDVSEWISYTPTEDDILPEFSLVEPYIMHKRDDMYITPIRKYYTTADAICPGRRLKQLRKFVARFAPLSEKIWDENTNCLFVEFERENKIM